MALPLFSIIIPTLNEEEYIGRLLADLSKQTVRDFEVIVVDGASEDATRDIAASYSERFPLAILTTSRRNLCLQRNRGAEHARGAYLIFLDADIQISAQYLAEIDKTIRKSRARFLTTYQLADVESTFDTLLVKLANYTLELLALIGKQMAPGYNFIVEKKLFFKAGKFDPNATFSEDHELSIRIGKAGAPLKIIRRHLLRWSFRRIRRDGRLPIIAKYALATFYTLISGKITDKNFGYPMGGSYFKEVARHRDFPSRDEFDKYISKMKRALKELIISA